MVVNLKLGERIDSTNAADAEKQLTEGIKGADSAVIDCGGLEYISSAGLRVLLRLKKGLSGGLRLTDVSREVYEILEMTGFTSMFDVQKRYRVVSVEGCEVIGEGANGIVYSIDDDTAVKVFKNPDSLDEIHREQELARSAFVLGVPTAIAYDVVRISDGVHYGSVFELLNARNYAKLLASGEKTPDEIGRMSVEVLRMVHSAVPKEGLLPERRDAFIDKTEKIRDSISPDEYDRLMQLLRDMPHDPHMLHGDFHVKNIMVQNGESLLIDMDTLAVGDPVFELAGMYSAYLGFAQADRNNTMEFLGISYETAEALWEASLRYYFNGDEAAIEAADKKIRLLAAVNLLSYMIKDDNREENFRQRLTKISQDTISELVGQVDDFRVAELLAQ